MRLRILLATALPLFALTACLELEDKEWEEGDEDEGDEDDDAGGGASGDIIAIGDSIFDSNIEDDASIPDVVGEELGLTVVNRAIGGTKLTTGPDSIPSQYRDGDWSAVIMDGGGNDLNEECGCGDCDALLDEMVSEDGESGVLPEFVAEVTGTGVPVVFWSYYEVPDSAEFGFDRCGTVLEAMVPRLEALADLQPNFHLVDGREAVSATDLQYYDDDHVHPSVAGSRVVGEQIAEALRGIGVGG